MMQLPLLQFEVTESESYIADENLSNMDWVIVRSRQHFPRACRCDLILMTASSMRRDMRFLVFVEATIENTCSTNALLTGNVRQTIYGKLPIRPLVVSAGVLGNAWPKSDHVIRNRIFRKGVCFSPWYLDNFSVFLLCRIVIRNKMLEQQLWKRNTCSLWQNFAWTQCTQVFECSLVWRDSLVKLADMFR